MPISVIRTRWGICTLCQRFFFSRDFFAALFACSSNILQGLARSSSRCLNSLYKPFKRSVQLTGRLARLWWMRHQVALTRLTRSSFNKNSLTKQITTLGRLFQTSCWSTWQAPSERPLRALTLGKSKMRTRGLKKVSKSTRVWPPSWESSKFLLRNAPMKQLVRNPKT